MNSYELLINETMVNKLTIKSLVNKPYVNFRSDERKINLMNKLSL